MKFRYFPKQFFCGVAIFAKVFCGGVQQRPMSPSFQFQTEQIRIEHYIDHEKKAINCFMPLLLDYASVLGHSFFFHNPFTEGTIPKESFLPDADSDTPE